ncbi:tyrosine recombinase XerD [Mycobacterium sp. MFM001]|uniref:tyrosine-type recombinase/integrase n=1 Tax=Mycobacterium sp. MFM001 TaxID=2049453 RepID=UPI000DA4DDAE|nr:tyrosine-type recombinase/integrase [Mycobacterium sp. MFM001]GBE65999.1 tyrosine recombinase XerD [Mycobacterium sp. MFM001]
MAESLLTPDLAELVPSWELALRAQNKSRTTLTSYLSAIRLYLRWCEENGHPPQLTRGQVQHYTAELVSDGKEPTTIRARHAALRQFAAWLAEEGELDANPLVGLPAPQLTTKVVKGLTEDQLRALLKACEGRSFTDRRDTAIVRLMAETGIRSSELVGLKLTDTDAHRGLVNIWGKGGKGRIAPFGPQTAAAIDRYLRVRRAHRYADAPNLWLGARGKGFGYFGLNDALRARAAKAGIEGFHLHLLRNTAATRWLAAGGSEGGLMAVAGWSSRKMLDRYTAATAAERAAAEARKLNLGDL